jgi:hypothetical protein
LLDLNINEWIFKIDAGDILVWIGMDLIDLATFSAT